MNIIHRIKYGRTPLIRITPLNAELNPICHLLAAHPIFHISRIKVNWHGEISGYAENPDN
jgi:hypothetical protein